MPPRRITDTTGVTWELWEVDAAKAAARLGRPADAPPALPPAQDSFRSGWLTASSKEERRRIAPVPSDWMFMTDTELRHIVERARDVPVVDERRGAAEAPSLSTPSAPRTLVRSFTDAAGVRWDAWIAHPMLHDRRDAWDRREIQRDSPERRSPQISGFGRGWLVFRSSGGVRHRLHSVPSGWHRFSDADLRLLLVRAARPVSPQRWSD